MMNRRTGRARPGTVLSLALASLFATVTGCSSLRVPLAPPSLEGAGKSAGNIGNLRIEAWVFDAAERYLDLFDDDLQEVGLAAAWVTLANEGTGAVDLRRLKWSIRTPTDEHPAMAGHKLLGRYRRQRGIRAYTVQSDLVSRQGLEKNRLLPTALAPGESAAGYLYFDLRKPLAPGWTTGAVLKARGLRIPGRKETSLDLPLSHASH